MSRVEQRFDKLAAGILVVSLLTTTAALLGGCCMKFCEDYAEVVFDFATWWEDGGFEVEVDEQLLDCAPLSVDDPALLQCGDEPVYLEISAADMSVKFVVYGKPEAITLRVLDSSGMRAEQTVVLVYEEYNPCGTTCWHAVHRVSME